jgi:group I intron endonuclease
MIFSIYTLTNKVNGKFYIGKTRNIQKRMYGHCRCARLGAKRNTLYLIHRAIRKYGIKNFAVEIIFSIIGGGSSIENSLAEDLVYEYERVLIKLFDARNKTIGYNISEGGRGNKGFKVKEKNKQMYREMYSGEKSVKTSLSNAEAEEIIKIYSNGGVTIKKIGTMFNVSKSAVQRIINRQTFKNVVANKPDIKNIGTRNHIRNMKRGEENGHSKLTTQDVLNIRTLYSEYRTPYAILAKRYNVSAALIGYIVNYKIWRHI